MTILSNCLGHTEKGQLNKRHLLLWALSHADSIHTFNVWSLLLLQRSGLTHSQLCPKPKNTAKVNMVLGLKMAAWVQWVHILIPSKSCGKWQKSWKKKNRYLLFSCCSSCLKNTMNTEAVQSRKSTFLSHSEPLAITVWNVLKTKSPYRFRRAAFLEYIQVTSGEMDN